MSLTVAYTGRHAAAAVFPLAALASRFLGSLRRTRTCERPDGAITVKGGSVTVRPVNGRNLGTQPRQQPPARTRRPGPWETMPMPRLCEPEPDGPSRAWDAGDGPGPLVPIARPYVPATAEFDADPGPEVLGQVLAALREKGEASRD